MPGQFLVRFHPPFIALIIWFSHHQHILSRGLFVQNTAVIASIIARMHFFLLKVRAEIPREQRKVLCFVPDQEGVASLKSEFALEDDSADGPSKEADDDIVAVMNLKPSKRPNQQPDWKAIKKQKGPPKAPRGDAIDDIFGSL